MSEDDYEQFTEQNFDYWKIPYSKEEILDKLKKQ